jgi:hypothetical protein
MHQQWRHYLTAAAGVTILATVLAMAPLQRCVNGSG